MSPNECWALHQFRIDPRLRHRIVSLLTVPLRTAPRRTVPRRTVPLRRLQQCRFRIGSRRRRRLWHPG